MINKKIIFIIIFIGLILIPFSFAQDNSTEVLYGDNYHLDIYFDASAPDDNGTGSKESPYKYLTKSRVMDNSNIYLNDGVYELDSSKTISSYNAFIGKSMENTIITYNNAGDLFSNNGVLILNNLTIKGASIYNTKSLTADNVIFRDSYSDYGGSIYSLPADVTISNSYFINNSAKLGGAICDIGSNMNLFNITAINNSAVYQGGAIYNMYTKLNLSSSLFINNSAGEGEAVFCDYSEFSMANNIFNQNNVYSAVNSIENFENNTFNQAELIRLDYYNTNFERSDYLQMIYNPYNSTIPSSYDLRDHGSVTSVKNQGSNGNCWAFAAIATLESCILKATGIGYDFSEENMKNLMAFYSDYGWDVSTNNGGNDNMIFGYYTSWMGPVNDSDDRYIINTYLSPLMESIMHVQNIVFLPRSSYTDNDAIKQAILNYGGVYTTLYATGQKCQYYTGSGNRDHAVEIIGWDDNFSKNNFGGTKPPADGAWICKNSWGENWGYNGYFYVSYYDTRFAQVGVSDVSWTIILNDTVKYDKNYQYDIIGITDYLLTNQSTIWYQNTFNATSDEIIAAFSTYFNRQSNFTVEIYVNEELKLTQNGSSEAGYFTINLDEFVPIYKNDVFKVVIKLTTSSEAWVPISEKSAATRVHYRPNASFISYDGVNWIDLYDYNITLSDRGHYYLSEVASIKAFTIFNLTTTTSLINVSGYDNNRVNFTATVEDQYGHLINEGHVIFEYGGVEYNSSVVNGIASLSLNNLKYGYSNLTAIYMNNTHYSSSRSHLTIYRPKHSVNLMVNVDDVYYGDRFSVDLSLADEMGRDVDAGLLLTVGDRSYNVNSNSVFIVPDLFLAGNYTVSVVYDGNDSYYGDVVYSSVVVSKYDVNLGVSVDDVNYGQYLTFNVSLISDSELVNENVTLNINNINYTVSANAEFILPVILNASTYNVNVYYDGNEMYNAINLTTAVKVFKINPNLEFKINSIAYGENLIAEVKLTGLNDSVLDENVIFIINNRRFIFNANSNFTIPLELDAGSYNAAVIFNGNSNYNFFRKITNFNISKNDVNIDLFVSNSTYGEKTIVNTYLGDLKGNLINESLKLEIGGNSYNIISNSEFALPVVLNASTYSAKVSFEGNNNYNGNYVVKSFVVNKADIDLDLTIENITYGDYLLLDNYLNYDLILEVNNKNYSITASSVNVIPDLLDIGDYEARIIFSGNDNYNSASEDVRFTVSRSDVIIDLSVSNSTYGEDIIVNTYLGDLKGNLINESLKLEIDGNSYDIYSNSMIVLPVVLNASTYSAKVSFEGNSNYNPNFKLIEFSVDKVTPNLTLNISDICYGDYIWADIKLTGINDSKLNENVILSIYGKKYSVEANGNYTLPIYLDAGDFEANVIFKGSANYNSASENASFTVSRSDVIIDLSVSNSTYGEDIIVNTYLGDLKGNLINESLKLEIDGNSYDIYSNSMIALPVVLNASTYSAKVSFEGDNNYNGNYVVKSFVVNKADIDLGLTIENIMYGDYLLLDNDLNYDLILEVNDKNYSIEASSVNVIPDLLDAGSYEAKIIFSGDNNHYSNSQMIEFSIDKSTPNLSLNISDIYYGNYIQGVVKLICINGSELNENISLTVNNENYAFKANRIFSIPVILDASDYPINVYFEGNNNYNSVSQDINVRVNKIDPKLVINVSDIVYNGDLRIKNTLTGIDGSNIDEILTLLVNDKKYDISSNSQFSLPDSLEDGKYTADITFNGNNNYNKVNSSMTFNVYPITLDMELSISKNVNNVSIYAKLSSPISAEISLKINNVDYTVGNGEVLNLYDLDLGYYSVEAKFNETGYESLLIKDNFTIDFINTLIKSQDILMYYHDGTRLKGVLTDSNNNILTNKSVNIFINGIKYTRTTDNNGSFSINLGLNSGKYLATLEFNGDDNHNYSSKEILVNIQSTVHSSDLIKYYRNGSQFYATLFNYDGNCVEDTQVEMNINGVVYTRRTNSEGVVRLNINLMPGKYIITLKNSITAESVSNNITVLSKLVENHDLVKYYRNASKYTVKILDDRGSPLAGVNVSFNINGVFYTRQTNSDGIASLNINLLPGDYIITAQYGGLKVSNSIKVLSVIETQDIVMKYRDGTKFTAKILDSQGHTYPNQSVTFNINGVFYTRITNSDGVAKLNINLMPGKYIITSMFNGLSVSNTILIE